MAFANNRAAQRPRSSFQVAGGTTVLYRHPFLSGQISLASPVDQIDISRAMKLNDTFLDANASQANSFQEVLVDGSTITITNHLMNGVMNLQVLRTTGLVGTGDFIAALHLVIASKDDIGGTLTVKENINGESIITVFYGVSAQNVPHLKKAGNAVIVYPVSLLYSGWVQGKSAAMLNEKTIWAVGNQYGLKGIYMPYELQQQEAGADFYSGQPLSAVGGVGGGAFDDPESDNPNLVPTEPPAGGWPSFTPSESDPNPTWP